MEVCKIHEDGDEPAEDRPSSGELSGAAVLLPVLGGCDVTERALSRPFRLGIRKEYDMFLVDALFAIRC